MKAGKEEGVKKEYNTNGELTQETYFNGGNIDAAKTKNYEPKKPESADAVKAPEEKEQKGTAPPPDAGMKPNTGAFNGERSWDFVQERTDHHERYVREKETCRR